MKNHFSVYNHCKSDSWFFMIIPSVGIGYYRKFLCITLYFLAWEFSFEFDWEE